MRSRLVSLAGCAAVLAAAALRAGAGQDPPRFRTGVDLLPVDVTVVDGDGRPIRDLRPEDFDVLLAGKPRRVVSAEWIQLAGGSAAGAPSVPPGYSSNFQVANGRLLVLAIDQFNIRFGGGRAVADALFRFIDRLSPSDRVSLVSFGRGGVAIPFTADRARVKEAISRVNGQMQTLVRSPLANTGVTLATAAAIAAALERGEREYREVMDRLIESCPLRGAKGTDTCETEIMREATMLLQNAAEERRSTARALGNLLTDLKALDAPKSLILVSEGPALLDEDVDAGSELSEIGRLAAAARTTIYGLRLDNRIADATAAFAVSSDDDRRFRERGFERLTSAARGTTFTVTTTGTAALERIESELSGYYILGIEAVPADYERPSTPLRVEIGRRGVTVRARTTVVPPSVEPAGSGRSPQALAAAALASPLALATLPLRVTSVNLQGPDPSKVQVLIHADVGSGYRDPQTVAVAYMIAGADGRIVETEAQMRRLTPPVAGLSSALPFVIATALPPGEYTLKLAAAEGGRAGTVQHALRASLASAGALALSDLVVGGPVPSGSAPLRPSIDYTVRFGAVQGYLEVYGPSAAGASVKYEVAAEDGSSALLGEEVSGTPIGEGRWVFSRLVSTSVLPPGPYQLRAIVTAGDAPIATVARAFEIADPSDGTVAEAAVPSKPAEVLGSGRTLFLPIAAADLGGTFDVEDALRADTLQSFKAMVPPAARRDFDEGVGHLQTSSYQQAQASFKRAIRPDAEFTAAVSYLALALAAQNQHVEAANAWQTALAGRDDIPQLYEWLGTTLLRAREFARARSVLEEAVARWPADARFARPLAMLYATTGRGYDAVQMLQKHLAANDADARALSLGVQWIYEIHVNGSVLRDRAADIALAQSYAAAYARTADSRATSGSAELVKQWISYLTKSE